MKRRLTPLERGRYIARMREQSLEFLKTLVNTPSPVGHEVRGQRVWLDYAGQFADSTFSDAYGNCVAVLNKGGSPRLMLAGHADEIAMAANYITDEGFIYVRKMGGINATITRAQRVLIHTRNGPVKGVVGNVAPHLKKEEDNPKPPKIQDLFIERRGRRPQGGREVGADRRPGHAERSIRRAAQRPGRRARLRQSRWHVCRG